MEQKKETNAQLKRRIEKAVVHVDKDKDTKEIFFDDKGLRLAYNNDFAVVGTLYHRHVFSRYTSNGESRPYIFVSRLIDIAFENDCTVVDEKGNKKGYSFAKLKQTLKDKKDSNEYNVVWYTDLWLFNIFQPLYSIDETAISATLVYEQYMHNIACNSIILSEKKEDMTNRQYIEKVCESVLEFTQNVGDQIMFHALTDEEYMEQELNAMQEEEMNQQIAEQYEGQSEDVE